MCDTGPHSLVIATRANNQHRQSGFVPSYWSSRLTTASLVLLEGVLVWKINDCDVWTTEEFQPVFPVWVVCSAIANQITAIFIVVLVHVVVAVVVVANNKIDYEVIYQKHKKEQEILSQPYFLFWHSDRKPCFRNISDFSHGSAEFTNTNINTITIERRIR